MQKFGWMRAWRKNLERHRSQRMLRKQPAVRHPIFHQLVQNYVAEVEQLATVFCVYCEQVTALSSAHEFPQM